MKKLLFFFLVLMVSSVSAKVENGTIVIDEEFLVKKMQTILESKIKDIRHSVACIDECAEKKCNQLTNLTSGALGYGVALGLTLLILNKPTDVSSLFSVFFKLLCGVAIGGTILHEGVFQPILRFFIVLSYRFLYRDDNDPGDKLYRDALTEFVRSWCEFKPFTPHKFREKFDHLYCQYMKHRGRLLLTEDQAIKLFDSIVEKTLNIQHEISNRGINESEETIATG